MTPITNQQAITGNGEYTLEPELPGREVILEWAVSAGSATITPGYVNLAGVFVPVTDLQGESPSFAASGGLCRLTVPNSGLVALKVENASGLTAQACRNPARI